MSDFHERKAERTERYFKYVYKNKLIKCSACDGSGWYDNCRPNGDNIPCGNCLGSGRERQR